jgi:hypothetical protein
MEKCNDRRKVEQKYIMQDEGILTKMVGRKYSQPNYNHHSFPPVCGTLDKVSYE